MFRRIISSMLRKLTIKGKTNQPQIVCGNISIIVQHYRTNSSVAFYHILGTGIKLKHTLYGLPAKNIRQYGNIFRRTTNYGKARYAVMCTYIYVHTINYSGTLA